MAEAITDRDVVRALRPFVRAAGPLVDSLRESNPFGLRDRVLDRPAEPTAAEQHRMRNRILDQLASMHVPGTAAWAAMDLDQRVHWWMHRVGRFVSLLTAVPGIAGALSDRFPIQDALGAASQGLLLCAIAGEHGVDQVGDRVRLLGWVLFHRDLDRDLAAGIAPGTVSAEEEQQTAQLTEELAESRRKHGKVTPKAIGSTVWRLGRALLALSGELEKRPRGRFYHRAMGALPVVGIVGDYLGERSALRRVSKAATKWLARNGVRA